MRPGLRRPLRHLGDGHVEILDGCTGVICGVGRCGREIESYPVPTGAALKVKDGETAKEGSVLCEWNPYSIPILSEVTGKVRFEDIVEGETMRAERESSGNIRLVIVDHKGDLHPQIVVEDEEGKALDVQYLPERAGIMVKEGDPIIPGTVLAEMPREAGGVADITGGLPRVTEIFEARKPKDPAVIAEGRSKLTSAQRRPSDGNFPPRTPA